MDIIPRIRTVPLLRASDVAFAEKLMGQPTSIDNYRGYDVSRSVVIFAFFSAVYYAVVPLECRRIMHCRTLVTQERSPTAK